MNKLLLSFIPILLFANITGNIVKATDGDTVTILTDKKQIKDGYTWAYVKYGKQYANLEQEAKEAKKGLWQDSNPTPPWEWRKKK